MTDAPSLDSRPLAALLGMTAVTGLIDAVSFLSLGHVFTANMTGNVVFVAFAVAGVPGLSLARSVTALAAFFVGAAVSGRIVARQGNDPRVRAGLVAFALETALLGAATAAAFGYRGDPTSQATQTYELIVLTALAMGMRNASVRKLAIPDLTTTVLTLTITGLAADSSLAGGTNPRWRRRLASVLLMFVGAVAGALLSRLSVLLTISLACATSAICGLAMRSFARAAPRA